VLDGKFRLPRDTNGLADHAEGRTMFWPHRCGFDWSAVAAPHGPHRVVTEALPHDLLEMPQFRADTTKALFRGDAPHSAARVLSSGAAASAVMLRASQR
jgi:hypothetical protein